MARNYNYVFLLACMVSLLCSSCSKMYWYRDKLKVSRPVRIPVQVKLVNYSPAYVSPSAEAAIRQACVDGLRKKGFVVARRDTPRFCFTIAIQVDSYYVKQRGSLWQWNNVYNTSPVGRYDRFIRDITLRYSLVYYKSDVHHWDDRSEFYFFNEERSDVRRSRSVINYTFRRQEIL